MSDAKAPGERKYAARPNGSGQKGAVSGGVGSNCAGSARGAAPDELFAALDLGTNNCRLLVAAKTQDGFRVVDAYSRIVRLGEGLTQTGRLQPAAMDRAVEALKVCAERIKRKGSPKVRAIATQACRSAENGGEFVERVERETGLGLQVITPREEARLSVAGCANLIDRSSDAALVLDVGGGSTELSWIDLSSQPLSRKAKLAPPPILAWLSVPIGVVSLAETLPEQRPGQDAWFRTMVEAVKAPILAFERAEPLRAAFAEGRAHLIGTSGAITSLAGLHLGLKRYERTRVDGLWLTHTDCTVVTDRLLAMSPQARADEPCIGPDRADLVLAGAAILQAVQELWPCERVRVADRGLREGLLLSLMHEQGDRRRRARRRRQKALARAEAA